MLVFTQEVTRPHPYCIHTCLHVWTYLNTLAHTHSLALPDHKEKWKKVVWQCDTNTRTLAHAYTHLHASHAYLHTHTYIHTVSHTHTYTHTLAYFKCTH